MFSIDFQQLAIQILAYFMRTPFQMDWMFSFSIGLTNLYNDFIIFSSEILYELGITYQVCYLEKVLNDKFNGGDAAYTFDNSTFTYSPKAGSIYIIDNPDLIENTYLWTDGEIGIVSGVNPWYLWTDAEVDIAPGANPFYLWTDAEVLTSQSFVVMIPTTLIDITSNPQKVAQIKAWLNKFRMAGCFYILQNY